MFSRYLFALCLIAISAVAINAGVVVQHDIVEDIAAVVDFSGEVSERANPAVKAVAKILGRLFASAAAGCLMEAAGQCKGHWKNPKKALSCGKNFLKQNTGRCAAGR